MRTLVATFGLLSAALFGCRPGTLSVREEPRASMAVWLDVAARVVQSTNRAATATASEPERCSQRIHNVLNQPPLPGTPELDVIRTRLLSSVKAEPVLFLKRPEYVPTDDPGILSYRRWLERTRHPLSVLGQLMPFVLTKPEAGRLVLLRDGYLYAETTVLAEALVRVVRAEHLFREPLIWIQRGQRLLTARREGKVYRYADGVQQGEVVTLLLFDRVGTGPVPRALHRDLRALRDSLHFHRMDVRHRTDHAIVAELFYGNRGVVTLLETAGPRTSLACELIDSNASEEVSTMREQNGPRTRAFRSVQSTIARQIDDRLPFDEPRHERGQEDGKMRPLWRWAYEQGQADYRIRLDVYPVFDARGRPLIPEVCVDFLIDTLERAGGTWWRPRGEPRERTVGRFDFDRFDRLALRRAPEFVAFARAHPEWFDVLELPEAERYEMRDEAFFEYLIEHGVDFQPGDIVLIAGRTPWDPSRTIHYHSFFVFESDPMSGMPTLVAGNPGRPRLVPWQWEARRTPRRSLRYRIRLNAAWLEAIVVPVTGEQLEPPPLSFGPP